MVEYDKIGDGGDITLDEFEERLDEYSMFPINEPSEVTYTSEMYEVGDLVYDFQLDLNGMRHMQGSSIIIGADDHKVKFGKIRFPMMDIEEYSPDEVERQLRGARRLANIPSNIAAERMNEWQADEDHRALLPHWDIHEQMNKETIINLIDFGMDWFKREFGDERADWIMDDDLVV